MHLEVFLEVLSRESLFRKIGCELFVRRQIGSIHKSVTVNSFAFMHPQSHDVVWFFDRLFIGSQYTLEDACQVPDIELVMEVNGRFPEVSLDFLVECNRSFDDGRNQFLNRRLEA